MANEKTILVYDHFTDEHPVLMGKLYVNVIRGGETYSFEYDRNWLAQSKLSVPVDPSLYDTVGRQYPGDNNIFGVFADASPDRWDVFL